MDRDALSSMLVFLEVVERGTLAGAAQALHVTPPAIR
jgi:DNA-binding transcriptional LysR family regulator